MTQWTHSNLQRDNSSFFFFYVSSENKNINKKSLCINLKQSNLFWLSLVVLFLFLWKRWPPTASLGKQILSRDIGYFSLQTFFHYLTEYHIPRTKNTTYFTNICTNITFAERDKQCKDLRPIVNYKNAAEAHLSHTWSPQQL